VIQLHVQTGAQGGLCLCLRLQGSQDGRRRWVHERFERDEESVADGDHSAVREVEVGGQKIRNHHQHAEGKRGYEAKRRRGWKVLHHQRRRMNSAWNTNGGARRGRLPHCEHHTPTSYHPAAPMPCGVLRCHAHAFVPRCVVVLMCLRSRVDDGWMRSVRIRCTSDEADVAHSPFRCKTPREADG
jgi:hypothetical protein